MTGYDHVSHNGSKQADISDLPEEDDPIKICIYSQSLMGSNWKEYIEEGHRVLEYNGEIIISESVERYDTIKEYIGTLQMKIIKDEYDKTKRRQFESESKLTFKLALKHMKTLGFIWFSVLHTCHQTVILLYECIYSQI